MKIFSILVFAFFSLSLSVFTQDLNKPKLVATWSYSGGGDYLEFLGNTVGEIYSNYSKNSNSKAVAVICSKNDLPTALVSSVGFPLYFFDATQIWRIPADKVYLARSAKCAGQSQKVTDQYWFVLEESNFESDEIIPAKNVSHERWSVGYYENYESKKARDEFSGYIKEFVKSLIQNPASQGFIVSRLTNRRTESKIQLVSAELRKEKIDANRVKIIRKKMFYDLYPELLTVTIVK